jgi:hypothetical protein
MTDKVWLHSLCCIVARSRWSQSVSFGFFGKWLAPNGLAIIQASMDISKSSWLRVL